MEHYGIRGVTQNWLGSYLSNKFQYVKINNTESQLRRVACGVPQGSVLGPNLFILYLNYICKVSITLKFVTFADDTNVFCSGNVIKELLKTAERELIVL